jgi:hypothetical protein
MTEEVASLLDSQVTSTYKNMMAAASARSALEVVAVSLKEAIRHADIAARKAQHAFESAEEDVTDMVLRL